jgi:hypothetical protein
MKYGVIHTVVNDVTCLYKKYHKLFVCLNNNQTKILSTTKPIVPSSSKFKHT